MAQKNSPPRKSEDMIVALRILQNYVASKPDWSPDAPQAADIEATADALESEQVQIAQLEAQLATARGAQQSDMANGSGHYVGVREEIYRKYGKDSDELINAGMQKLDLEPTPTTIPPDPPVLKFVEEVTPNSVKIRVGKVADANDYKYFFGTTPQTAEMTLKDTSTSTTFVYDGLTEGTKYYFAVKARNKAGESAFSAVANRRTY